MASETVPVSESLDVTKTPAEVQVNEHVVPTPYLPEEPVNVITDGVVVPYVPPRLVTPEEAREKALSGVSVGEQPIAGSGR